MSEQAQAIQPATAVNRHRFHLLDALRGVAAVMVAISHGKPYFLLNTHIYNYPLAVDFFFCLSGFVIAFSYEKRLQQTFRPQQFYVARLIRLYPLYFLGMTLGLLEEVLRHQYHQSLFSYSGDMRFYLQSLCFVPNLVAHISPYLFPFNNVAWTLFFEFLANAVYAIFIYKRIGTNWVLAAVASLSGLLIFNWICRGHSIWLIGWQNWLGSFLMGVPRVALPFSTGILVLRFYRRYAAHWTWPSRFGTALSLIVTAVLIFLLISPLYAMQSMWFAFFTVVFALPVLVLFGSIARPAAFLKGICAALGDSSYALYLLHMPCLSICALFYFSIKWSAQYPFLTPVFWLAFALTVASSLVVAKYVDAPFRSFLVKKYNAFVSASRTYAQ